MALILVACGQRASEVATLEIVGAEATSQTSLRVTFNRPVGAGADAPANYVISGPDGDRLGVLAAYVGADDLTVTLATEPQQLVTYVLAVRGVALRDGGAIVGEITAQGGFGGSGETAPIVASAIALSHTQVLVTFADPTSARLADMGTGATTAAYYEVSSPDLDVLSVAYAASGDRSRVILTTTSMSDLRYTVKVTNVLSATGSKLVDPFVNTAAFRGITLGDDVPPTVTEVFATDNTTLVVRFSEPVSDDAASPSRYVIRDGDGVVLPVVAVLLNDVKTEATLTTWPMTAGVTYSVEVTNITDRNGNAVDDVGGTPFDGTPVAPGFDRVAPRVLSANSTSNTTVVVTFDEPVMGGPDSAENAANYSIVDSKTLSGQVAAQAIVLVRAADLSADRRTVTLSTLSQSEMEYTLRVTDVKDLAGNQVAPPDRDRPYQVTFFGTGASGAAVDSDGDGLSDAAEQAGWTVTVRLDGVVTETGRVTSDPFVADTDGDGVSDYDERTYRTDPRSDDTDSDGLTDFQELNLVYSDPSDQDSDGDGLIDGLEFNFFRTSPILADTDGDQLLDGDEVVLANRNPRVADLPLPAIEVGAIDLRLDTRFTATSTVGTRELESRATSSTLTQAQERSFSNTDSNTHEFFAKASAGVEYSMGGTALVGQVTGRFAVETGYTGQWSSSFTRASSDQTQRAYESSLQTDVETTREESVAREVVGASMSATVTLRNIGNIAFTIANVEVTAFTLDPSDPTRLIPVATLRPQGNPGASYNLGPLIPQRGPLVFESSEVFPSTIEGLMRDPRGLVFKVANYDLTDEFGRNFAFTSQDINDRTAPIVIDFGGQDGDGDGIADNSARYRVATSAGRVVGDANGDGVVDDGDRRVFDDRGGQVGITLREALEDVLGLVRYDEDATPSSTLNVVELENSYSIKTFDGTSVLWRIRSIENGGGTALRNWEVISTAGIDRTIDFDSRLLRTEDGITLAFVQDADGDRVTARWEYLMGCSDKLVDTDGDGLSDYDEIYVGWEVMLPTGSYQVYPSCARTDSDLDGLTDRQESVNGTDPLRADTDDDGVSDFDELRGYRITLRFGIDPDAGIDEETGFGCVPVAGLTNVVECYTDPLDPDTDGDTLRDGDERRLGTDPTISDGDRALDNDGDGLVNFEETAGWTVTYRAVSTVPGVQGALVTCTPTSFVTCGVAPTSDPNLADTDGDGVPDAIEKLLGLHPRLVDTDGDGLSDFEELTYVPGTDAWELVYDPLDADMDDDLRSDGAEINVPITVRIVGEAPYDVFSDPLVADADLDGLVDGREATAGTDPTKFDTDGDGTSDGIEVARASDADTSNNTNPLRPDQLLRFTFAGLAVENGTFSLICGDTDRIDDGHFIGRLFYSVDGAETQLTTVDNGFTSLGFDRYFSAVDWRDLGTTTIIYDGGSIAARAADLIAVENVAGVRRDMNAINPDNTPVVQGGGGGFEPVANANQTIWTTDAVGTSNACTMRIRFTITPIAN